LAVVGVRHAIISSYHLFKISRKYPVQRHGRLRIADSPRDCAREVTDVKRKSLMLQGIGPRRMPRTTPTRALMQREIVDASAQCNNKCQVFKAPLKFH
jgi:hypothetical protein